MRRNLLVSGGCGLIGNIFIRKQLNEKSSALTIRAYPHNYSLPTQMTNCRKTKARSTSRRSSSRS